MRLIDTGAGPRLRLADDDRGRVPFALIGVLLLVGSVTWAVGLQERGAQSIERDAGAAIDRGEGVVRTELRQAVARADANAAREPVVAPADTPAGRALDDDSPYRDAFRARIYRQAADALDGVDERVGDVRVGASLPPVSNASTLRDAIERVTITEAGDGAVEVRLEGVELTARSGGRPLERSERSVTVTVATPALTLHERAERFERQLNRGALEGPGFDRRLTARLYPIAWARGYAQYGKAPIANVLANRHVELMANSALLQTQRSAIGTTDPDGREALDRATARVGTQDLLAPTQTDGQQWVETVLGSHPAPVDDGGPVASALDNTSGPDADEELTVGVNRSADRALFDLSGGRGGASLSAIGEELYSTETRRIVETTPLHAPGRQAAPGPGRNWTATRSTVRVVRTRVADSGRATPVGPYGWDEYGAYSRTVERTFVNETDWRDRNGSVRTTTERWTDRRHVGIAVVGDPADSDHAPDGRIERLYEPGGPTGGHNLEGVPGEAVRRLVGDEGGPDAVALAAVDGGLGDETTEIHRSPPAGTEQWVYRDVAALREEARDVSASVPPGRLATGAAPTADLADEIRQRRATERNRRHRYRSLADKARVAARIAYLDRLVDDLDRAAADVDDTQSGLDDALADADAATGDRLEALLSLRGTADPAAPRTTDAAPPAGELRLSVDGSPAYLTRASIDRSHAPSLEEGERFHPLAAESTNVFTVPYDSDPGGVLERLFGERETVGLRQGAQALRAAEGVHALADGRADQAGERVTGRSELRAEVRQSNDRLRAAARRVVREETDLDHRQSEAVVTRAFAGWDGPAERALAGVNGSAARAVAERAAERDRTPDTYRFRDELRTSLTVTLAETAQEESVRLPESAVKTVIDSTKQRAKQRIESELVKRQERLRMKAARRLKTVPVGLPVTPVPGYWYATANVWTVDVAGEYASFRIDARHGVPAGRGAVDGTTSYVRDGSEVTVDVTGDGDPERLGTAERVSFSAETTVIVAVPPGPGGVGDLDGQRTERSEGWPDPGLANESDNA